MLIAAPTTWMFMARFDAPSDLRSPLRMDPIRNTGMKSRIGIAYSMHSSRYSPAPHIESRGSANKRKATVMTRPPASPIMTAWAATLDVPS